MFISIVLSIALTITPAITTENTSRITPRITSIVHSEAAQDMKGYEPSLYRGKWYDPKYENTRKCIMRRESHFNYRAANPTSSARGAYQFLDSQWRDSLVWMLTPEHKHMKPLLNELRKTPIHKWNRYWQDAAFFAAWRHGDGKHHWYLGGTLGC